MAVSSGILGAFYVTKADGTPFTGAAATLSGSGTILIIDDQTKWQISRDKTTITIYKGGIEVTANYEVILGGVIFNDVQGSGVYTIDATPVTTEQLGGVFEWSLDIKHNVQDKTAFQDEWERKTKGLKGWTASAKKWWSQDSQAFGYSFNTPLILKLFNNIDNDDCWAGWAWIEGNKISNKVDGMNEEEINFVGEGLIQNFDSSIEPV